MHRERRVSKYSEDAARARSGRERRVRGYMDVGTSVGNVAHGL